MPARLDRGHGRALRRLIDQDAVLRRRGLQTCSGVDDIAGRHALSLARAGIERDERLAGRDADPDPQIASGVLPVQLGDRRPDRERSTHGALGIVLVCHRRAEERNDRVADELLDGAAVPFELALRAPVVALEERAHVLRIAPV